MPHDSSLCAFEEIDTGNHMNGRERVLCTLNHKEPDHVPLDIGGSDVTGVHRETYRKLAAHFGLAGEAPICEVVQQVVLPEEALLRRIGVDVRPLFPNGPDGFEVDYRATERGTQFRDEWGVEWLMPRPSGLYFDMIVHPLAKATNIHDVQALLLPDPADAGRFRGLRERAQQIRDGGRAAIMMMPPYGGMFESGFWLRGYTQFFLDLGRDPQLVQAILDRTLEFRLAYWERALAEVGDLVDIVVEYDDLGSTTSTLISPAMYRKYLKPRHAELYAFIKSRSQARVFLHSCGAIYHLIADFIEAGVDILNPIQVSAVNMGDGKKLKQEFGSDLVFWGGGINTQITLPQGSPGDVREEVRRRVTEFAPGGGYVFAAVHNIQPDVPVENIIAMLEAWEEFGRY